MLEKFLEVSVKVFGKVFGKCLVSVWKVFEKCLNRIFIEESKKSGAFQTQNEKEKKHSYFFNLNFLRTDPDPVRKKNQVEKKLCI